MQRIIYNKLLYKCTENLSQYESSIQSNQSLDNQNMIMSTSIAISLTVNVLRFIGLIRLDFAIGSRAICSLSNHSGGFHH